MVSAVSMIYWTFTVRLLTQTYASSAPSFSCWTHGNNDASSIKRQLQCTVCHNYNVWDRLSMCGFIAWGAPRIKMVQIISSQIWNRFRTIHRPAAGVCVLHQAITQDIMLYVLDTDVAPQPPHNSLVSAFIWRTFNPNYNILRGGGVSWLLNIMWISCRRQKVTTCHQI